MELNYSLDTASGPGIDESAPARERRSSNRQVSVMLTAKLETSGRQQPCRILNISSKGANIESLISLKVGQPIEIEFRSNLKSKGTIRWVRDAQAGVEFNEAIDLNEIWKRSEVSIKRIKPRPPRYCCFAPAMVEHGENRQQCQIIDISASGMRVVDVKKMVLGATVMIEPTGLPRHRAKVVWCNKESAGLKLVNPFKYHELEMWLLQQESSHFRDGTC
jgi:PilZ domain